MGISAKRRLTTSLQSRDIAALGPCYERFREMAEPTAVVFPGQGSQRPGMGADFCEAFACAREVFDEVSDALDLDMRTLCFTEDARLNLTEFTQPAILTVEMAMWRVLRELGHEASMFAGHSLGEYSALCAAGVLPVGVAAKVVRQRGALMQAAVPVGVGRMVVVQLRQIGTITGLLKLRRLDVDIANHNSPNQVVLSGTAEQVERSCQQLRELFGAEVELIQLNVSAPFHSKLMQTIEEPLRAALTEALAGRDVSAARQVTSNLTGTFHTGEAADLIDALTRQASSTVRWVANMRALAGAGDVLEVGPNRPLRGFFKAVGKDVTAVTSLRAAERLGSAA